LSGEFVIKNLTGPQKSEAICQRLKLLCQDAGFELFGVAPAGPGLPHVSYFRDWLAAGQHGLMAWMERHADLRSDIRKFFPGAESVVMVGHNYYTASEQLPDRAHISRYARGRDYHKVMKKKLKSVLRTLQESEPGLQGRIFTDTAPVMEKQWAARAGLGWQGKNTNIISRELGSWFFLGGIALNIVLPASQPVSDYCGNCSACIEACPTGALEPYRLCAEKCISYLTIELWDQPIPEGLAGRLENWVYGCDICQQVCPWNSFAKPTVEPAYQAQELTINPQFPELLALQESEFEERFRDSPLRRTGYKNFMRNVRAAGGNK